MFGVNLLVFCTILKLHEIFSFFDHNDYTLRLNLITPEYCFSSWTVDKDFPAFLSKLEQDVKDIFAKNKK